MTGGGGKISPPPPRENFPWDFMVAAATDVISIDILFWYFVSYAVPLIIPCIEHFCLSV